MLNCLLFEFVLRVKCYFFRNLKYIFIIKIFYYNIWFGFLIDVILIIKEVLIFCFVILKFGLILRLKKVNFLM